MLSDTQSISMAVIMAVVPVFLLIVLGFALKRSRWVTDAFWAPAERLTYYIFFPALLIVSGTRADLSGDHVWPMAVSLFAATLLAGVGAVALKPVLGLSDASFTSFFQGTFRPNTFIGVSIALLMAGHDGVVLMSIAILAVVPLANFMAVSALVLWGEGHKSARTPKNAAKEIAKNPLVLACLVGFGMNALDLNLPPVVEPMLDILGRAALPISLLAVGAGLDFVHLKSNLGVAAKASFFKLLALPAVAWGVGYAMGMDGLAFQMTILYACVSGSTSSYVLARQMGGDAPLMAGIITATLVAAMITMPLWMVAAG